MKSHSLFLGYYAPRMPCIHKPLRNSLFSPSGFTPRYSVLLRFLGLIS